MVEVLLSLAGIGNQSSELGEYCAANQVNCIRRKRFCKCQIAVFGTPVTTTGQLVSSARQRAAAAKALRVVVGDWQLVQD